MASPSTAAPRAAKFGIFLVSFVCLAFELLLMRIFSVTMWYHFAFLAVSVGMFGLSVGAAIVQVFPTYFLRDRILRILSFLAIILGASIPLAIATHLFLPLDGSILSSQPVYLAVNFLCVSIPFVIVGIIVCAIFGTWPSDFGALYGADLLGAGFGCLGLFLGFKLLTGLALPFLIGLIAVGASFCFSPLSRSRRSGFLAAFLFSMLLGLLVLQEHRGILAISWARGKSVVDITPLYDNWNSYSRIVVSGSKENLQPPFGWGLSTTKKSDALIRQLYLDIDSTAGTTIYGFDGELEPFEFLKYDIVNLAHYLRENARVAVIGVGGGRDILSALVFKQSEATGIEVNDSIVRLLRGPLAPFAGNLLSQPGVQIINDEARSYLTSSGDQLDIIQASLIDTYAATSAGAFALTESGLYTTEAWRTFLSKLSSRGILTFSRWYFRTHPAEAARLVTLAWSSLKQIGVSNPRSHIILARTNDNSKREMADIATILVSREPFSAEDLKIISDRTNELGFSLLLTPNSANDSYIEKILGEISAPSESPSFIEASPPTDDKPFFFNVFSITQIFESRFWRNTGNPLSLLFILFIIASLFSALFILVPLAFRTTLPPGGFQLSLCCALIGCAFMLVEIPLLQKVNLFLGHPALSLVVALPALLIGTGIGSMAAQRMLVDRRLSSWALVGTATVGIAIFGAGALCAFHFLVVLTQTARIGVSVAALLPLGILLGVMLPAVINQSPKKILPWLWGVNGSFSVCSSILAVLAGLSFGLSATLLSGFLCYVLTIVILWRVPRMSAE